MSNTSLPHFYVTTPIYYVNDRPHLGHVYTTTIADILARTMRLSGRNVFFLTGVDEHAAKVVDAAAQRNLSPQQWADQNAAVFSQTFSRFQFTHCDFVRTSNDLHKTKVIEYVSALMASNDIYQGQYEGWYDAGQEEYVTESKAQEYNFTSPINGKPLVRKTEKNYFFRLSQYRQALLDHYQKHPHFVQPQARRNEILNRIAEMQDVPISRSGAGGWGIPIPNDPQQTIYVWIDALFNYLSFVDTPARRPYWHAGPVHLIAKDILWFHAAIWPALLMALQRCPGYQWVNLPSAIYSHSFWISEGQKMSKSLGNFIDLEKLDHYIQTFGLDALRWFLATQGPLGTTDSDFSESKFIEIYNTDLANTFGNCLNRVCNMTNRYFAGKLPTPDAPLIDDPQAETLFQITATLDRWQAAAQSLDLPAQAASALELIRRVDAYIENTAPFKLAKDPARLPDVATILYRCAQAIHAASILLWPIIPFKVEQAWLRLGCDHASHLQNNQSLAPGQLQLCCRWGSLPPGSAIIQDQPLFPRHDPKNKPA